MRNLIRMVLDMSERSKVKFLDVDNPDKFASRKWEVSFVMI